MIIHKVEDYGTAYSVDADVPPADVSNNEGSMFKPGEAWQSPDRSRWIRVDAMTETGFTVTIGPQLRLTGGRLPALRKAADQLAPPPDRQSVGSGQSVSVRVALGGRRDINKKNKKRY